MNVMLFITCLTDTFEPRVGVAMVRLLRHFGCRVHFPPDQTCCGQPQYNNGYHVEAARLARRMIDVFEGNDYVVTPSGSCASMIKFHYPDLLKCDPTYAQRARRLAERTWEIGSFVTEVLKVDISQMSVKNREPVTVHYSCHLRGLQTPEQVTRWIRDMQGADYRPLEQMDQCCGFGGAFHVMYTSISSAIAGDKLACLKQTGAATVVSNEAGCTMTLGGAARRRGLRLKFKHTVEIWAESLGLLDDL